MIKSFKCKQTEKLFKRERVKKIPPAVQDRARNKLELIAAAAGLKFLRIPPSNRLERLKGDRAGQYSIRINNQWRICFIWKDGNAFDVEITDYH